MARSIWSHASKPQIEASLDSFARDAAGAGVLLASYLPARTRDKDYRGASWVGTSHESDVPGCIHHDRRWIRAACERRGLVVRTLGRDVTYRQWWLAITRRTGR